MSTDTYNSTHTNTVSSPTGFMRAYVFLATILAAGVSFWFAYTFGKAMSDTYAIAIALATICLTLIYSRWLSPSALNLCKSIATYGLIFFTILTGLGYYAMTAQEKNHPALAEARLAIVDAQAYRAKTYIKDDFFMSNNQMGNSAMQSERISDATKDVAIARLHYQNLIAKLGEYEVGPFAILGWLAALNIFNAETWGLIIGTLLAVVLCCNELCMGALFTGRLDLNGNVVNLGK